MNGMKNFKKFYESISEVVDISHLKKKVDNKVKSDKFVGQKMVFTGFRDKKLEEYIESNGGSVTTTVTSNTTLLVHSDTSDLKSSKIKKAIELKIPIIKKSSFITKYGSSNSA